MDFSNASDEFLQWFNSQSGTAFHPDLQIIDLRTRHAGRGIIARANIPAETDLFTIPRSLIIDSETSTLAQKLPHLFLDEDGGRLSDGEDESASDVPVQWLNLILIILYETFHFDTSPWKPYFSILPTRHTDFDTLMFWNTEQLTELQASEIRSKIGRESANHMFHARIIPVVNQHTDVFYPDGHSHLSDNELLERCHIIGSLIMSYAFDLEPDVDEDEDETGEDGWVEDRTKPAPMGMVPMADMLNADAEFNAHLSHGENALTMTSLREIKAGEEVLNYYGPLPNAELLRRYGYTSSKHSRYDVVELSWPLVKGVLQDMGYWDGKCEAVKLEAIVDKLEQDNELDDDDGFVLERESGDLDEQGRCSGEAKFDKIPDELGAVINAVVKKMYKEGIKKRELPDNTADDVLKHRVLVLFSKIIDVRLDQYSTSIAEDEALLSSSDHDRRRAMAIEIRLGEKRLLRETLSWCKDMQQKYASNTTTQNGVNGNHKKQKR